MRSAARAGLLDRVAPAVRRLRGGGRSGASLRLGIGGVCLVWALRVGLSPSPPVGILLNGVILGLLYGLIAAGMVLIFRANRIISFAQAGFGSVPAVVGLHLFVNRSWPFALAALVAIAGSLVLGGVVDAVILRRLANAPRLILTVATIGIAQLLTFVELFIPQWFADGRRLPPQVRTPFSRHQREIGDYFFRGDHLVAVVVVVGVGAGLAAFLRYTRLGLGIRAAAENAPRAALVGIPVRGVSTVVWALAALLSATGVFLRAPIVGVGVGPTGLASPVILLYALAIAVIARMSSLPTVFVAGAAIGMLDQAVFYSTRNSNLTVALTLPLVLVVLLAQRARLARAEDSGVASWQSAREYRPVPVELRRVGAVLAMTSATRAVVVIGLVLAPFVVGPFRQRFLVLMVVYALLALSLVVLTGWGGQISLGQVGFAGVGAAMTSSLVVRADADVFVALLAAGAVGSCVAVVVGVPALRVQGLFLAVTTLAFAAAASAVLFDRRYFGWLLPDEGATATRPVLFDRIDLSSDRSFYYFSLVILLLAASALRVYRSTRSGRVVVATRDHPRLAQALGVNLGRTRLVVFAISGFLAGVAGSLLFYLQGAIDRSLFDQTASIQIFALAVIGGITSVGGALAGAAYVVGFQYLVPRYAFLASGAGMLVLLLYFPGGLAELGYACRDAFLRRVAARRSIHVPSLVADSLVDDHGDESLIAQAAAESREVARS